MVLQTDDGFGIQADAFQRDLYLLTALILADEPMLQLGSWAAGLPEHCSAEVGRLLILTAVAARQMMDVQGGIFGEEYCGEYCADVQRSGWRRLRFRRACNAIIHGLQITPEASSPFEPPSEQASGEAAPADIPLRLIRIRGRDYGRNTQTRLDGIRYARCCAALMTASR